MAFQTQRNFVERKRSAQQDTPVVSAPVSEYNQFEEDLKHATIFVSVASFRDSQCPFTVADIFAKAKYPGRVKVGICQQNAPEDVDCLSHSGITPFLRNIRVMRLVADEARGPVYARALIEQNLFQDEAYYLVIDSHTLFSWDWDVQCIEQLVKCPSEKPVLTCYPMDYDLKTRKLPPPTEPPLFLKFRNFHPRLGFSQQDPVRFRYLPPTPQPSLFWAAGFSFTLGEVVREVPYDINLQYVFLGEEITMAARLYTHGYDTFAPMTNILFHYTSRTYRPVFWSLFYKKDGQCAVSHEVRTARKELEEEGNNKMTLLLSGEPIPAPYGLGTVRTLAEFEDFVGLDLKAKTFRRHSARGLTARATPEEMYYKYGLSAQ